MNQRPDIHGTREELVAFIADQQAEIGRLRFMGKAKDNANAVYAERNAELAERNAKLAKEIKWLLAALQRIVDNGEQSGFAYGVAFAALRASKDES